MEEFPKGRRLARYFLQFFNDLVSSWPPRAKFVDDLTVVDYILKKANKRLYLLRAFRRSGVSVPDMVNIYCAVIRSVVEYALPVFSNLPAILCCALERMQKHAL